MPTVKVTQADTEFVEIKNETVNVTVKPPAIPVKVVDDIKHVFEFQLDLRRALNGDLMIFDHADVDIVVLLEKRKIVAFAKDMMTDVVYGASNRLFTHLRRQGVVAYDSIRGGNVYGSLEGLMLENKDKEQKDSVDYVLYQISEWMKEEKPYFEAVEAYDEMIDDAVLDPDEDNSTELGEVPHEEEKGAIRHGNSISPYYYGRWTY